MGSIITIARRELSTFYDSMIAYMLLGGFLALCGFFTWLYGGFFGRDVFFSGQASIAPFFGAAVVLLWIFIAALSMKLFAEETKTGTLELLLTKPVTDWQVVMGKFLACVSLIFVALLCSLPYYFTVAWLGPVDHGAVWCGYLGLLLVGSTYAAIGIMCSSLTDNQIVAFLLTIIVGIIFLFIFSLLSAYTSGMAAKLFDYLSILTHYSSIARGVVDSKDIIYFLSIIGFCLMSTVTVLSRRKIAD